jgi:hypothetical protein
MTQVHRPGTRRWTCDKELDCLTNLTGPCTDVSVRGRRSGKLRWGTTTPIEWIMRHGKRRRSSRRRTCNSMMDRREALLLVERLKRRTRDPEVLTLCEYVHAPSSRR